MNSELAAHALKDASSPWMRSPDVTFPGDRLKSAVADLAGGLRAWPFWTALAWQRTKNRYRRSVLGPFWITLSLAVLVAVLGSLYSMIMGRQPEVYVPHLALGFIAWQFISGVVQDGARVFISSARWIVNTRMPLSAFALMMIHQNYILMAHHMAVYVVVAAIFGIWCGWAGLLLVPALALYAVTALPVALLVGLLCARLRDLPQVIDSAMRIAFFATPIIWMPTQLNQRAVLAEFNPFYHYVELFRAPLLGTLPSASNWLVALACTALLAVLAAVLFSRRRHRIPYWL